MDKFKGFPSADKQKEMFFRDKNRRVSCKSQSAGSAQKITSESILGLGMEIEESLRKIWIKFFKDNGFDVEAGDKCVMNRFVKSPFPKVPSGFASQIFESDLLPEGTAVLFMKHYDPFKIDVTKWN